MISLIFTRTLRVNLPVFMFQHKIVKNLVKVTLHYTWDRENSNPDRQTEEREEENSSNW